LDAVPVHRVSISTQTEQPKSDLFATLDPSEQFDRVAKFVVTQAKRRKMKKKKKKKKPVTFSATTVKKMNEFLKTFRRPIEQMAKAYDPETAGKHVTDMFDWMSALVSQK
jgi:hypothetical protein